MFVYNCHYFWFVYFPILYIQHILCSLHMYHIPAVEKIVLLQIWFQYKLEKSVLLPIFWNYDFIKSTMKGTGMDY
jgi:hypothetical protein